MLIIGLGGGNDVWAAKINGARSIKAIALNWPIVDIHRNVLEDFLERPGARPRGNDDRLTNLR